eukprot:Pgem_evm1s3103
MCHGMGTQTYKDGNYYKGEWKNDKYDGQGLRTFRDGSYE